MTMTNTLRIHYFSSTPVTKMSKVLQLILLVSTITRNLVSVESSEVCALQENKEQLPTIWLEMNSERENEIGNGGIEEVLHFQNKRFSKFTNASSTQVFANCNVSADFLCTANYPVEWVVEYDKDVTFPDPEGSKILNHLTVDRELAHCGRNAPSLGFDMKTVMNYAYLGLDHNRRSSKCVSFDYTCRSVSNPCLSSETNVISKIDESENTVQFISSDAPLMDSPAAITEDLERECETSVIITTEANGQPGFKCVSSLYDDVKVDYKKCDNAMRCNSLFRHHQKQHCWVRKEKCEGCELFEELRKAYGSTNSTPPGIITCYRNNKAMEIVLLLQAFFAVPQRTHFDRNFVYPSLYLDWTEANPEEMLYLYANTSELYIGQTVAFFCSVSKYYFAFGAFFTLEYFNGTTSCLKAIGEGLDWRYKTYIANVTIDLNDPSLERVVCHAPVWNSTEWINKSIEIDLRMDPDPPRISLALDSEETPIGADVTLKLHEINKSITCKGYGRPMPKVEWLLSSDQISNGAYTVKGAESSSETLVFDYIKYPNVGSYDCKAENFMGTAEAIVNIKVKDEMKIVAYLTVVILCTVLVIFGMILSLCWAKVRRQRKKIHELSDPDYRKVTKGDADELRNAKYINTSELINALPLNRQFDIPLTQLVIDFSKPLGRGHFGEVFKGYVVKVEKRRTIEVAVKMTRSRFNRMQFDTLVSELKLVSNIGYHANIVSLVGACTEKLRSKQLYVAMEYCSKGNLEQFLRRSRESFVNLISNDRIYMTLALLEGNHRRSEVSICTHHLLMWAREIANAMEFLGSKRIVHGDLAARNILLTECLVAKVGDFGLSHKLGDYSGYIRMTGEDLDLPWKWLSYEVLREGKFSPQSDVWAYGICLWEIFSLAERPYEGLKWNVNFIHDLEVGHRLDKPQYASTQFYSMMRDCWELDPSRRPSFSDMKNFFEDLLQTIGDSEYFRTDGSQIRNSTQYINSSLRVDHSMNNPGYYILTTNESSVSGTGTERTNISADETEAVSVLDGEGGGVVRFDNRVWKNLNRSPIKDAEGYLRPLMLTNNNSDEESSIA